MMSMFLTMSYTEMAFWALWAACGIGGALIQRRWYARRNYQQPTAGLDFVVNAIWGPIALIGCAVAYGGQ